MIKLHEKATRGRTTTGWLNSFHTFSFGSFNDPTRMGFGNLRVLNEDTIAPGSGFAPHDHSDMDILTFVLSGALEHKDDQGNHSRIGKGEIQLMSAGDGVRHSEFNASRAHPARFLQIWLIPDVPGGQPTYAQASVPEAGQAVLAAPKGGLVPLRSRSSITRLLFEDGDTYALPENPEALRFLHLVDGMARADGENLSAGDGLQIPPSDAIGLSWISQGEALLFEMPLTRKDTQK
ncbi:pirin-like bicupin family protein [uncultured Tateyamaria sp.]|uniref:pirin family protein n=1 Tax=uncultured Tateyamaria sp. TaxID=455651 RepID=UPI002627D57A|nr:pirin-like bicupin family protein [uncultured Tateyamaria sp.]